MFMRRNRAINGAAQPEDIASADASAQRDQAKLSTNDYDFGTMQNRLFEPSMETIEAISSRHKSASVTGDAPSGPSYESHIAVGPKHPGSDPHIA